MSATPSSPVRISAPLAAALVALAAVAGGCRARGGTGMATVEARLGAGPGGRAAALPPEITSVDLTVSGQDMAPVQSSLPLDGSVVAVSVPAGRDRLFQAAARAGAVVTHRGSTLVAELVADSRTRISIALDPVTADTTAPTVVGTSPADGATGVAAGTVVMATFSEGVDPATVTASTFTLVGPAGPVTALSVGASGSTATLVPVALEASTTYTATLGTGVTDLAGNPLPAAVSWTFTTAPPADVTPPSVVSTSPADAATAVPVSALVTATFSEPVDPATVTSGTFTLAGPAGPVAAASIGVVGSTTTFEPAGLLAPGARYTATIAAGVADLAGNPLPAPVSWAFTTAPATDFACEPAVQLQPEYAFPLAAAAAGPSGDVLALGVPGQSQPNAIWSRRYRAGAGWAPSAPVADPANPERVLEVRVAGSEQGDALAAWTHVDAGGTVVTLWARRWDAASGGWAGTPVLVSAGTCPPYPCTGALNVPFYDVTIDGNGDATLVWSQDDVAGTTVNVYARRWTRAGGLEASATKLTSDPAVAFGVLARAGFGGTVIALWSEQSQARTRAWRGGVWGVASTLALPRAAEGLAVDDAGGAVAIYGGAPEVGVARTPPGPDAWGGGRTLRNAGNQPRVAADAQGRAVAIWHDTGGSRATFSASFDPAVQSGTPPGWTDPAPIDAGDGNNLTLRLASNRAGDAVLGEDRLDASERPTASVRAYRVASGWDAAGMHDVGESGRSLLAALAVDPLGSATVLWRQRSTGIPFATRCGYPSPPPVAPMVATGSAFAIALKSDGSVWAWGVNGSAQLGQGSLDDSLVPVQVRDAAGAGFLSGIVRVAASASNAFALSRDGTVWAWGSVTLLGGEPSTQLPVRVRGPGGAGVLSGIGAIAAGASSAYAVRRTDGTVWAWGTGSNGQLGDGTTTGSTTPVQVQTTSRPLVDVASVAAGQAHALALALDGSVWAWGSNANGQCGLGAATSIEPLANQVLGPSGAGLLGPVVELAAPGTNGNSVARDATGAVYAWGYGGNGMLGSGDGAPALLALPGLVPSFSLAAPPATGAPALSGSNAAVLALRADGTTWAWGSGELVWWDGVVTSRPSPSQVTAPSAKTSTTLGIASSVNGPFAFLIEDDGSLWGWGNGVPGLGRPPPASVLSGIVGQPTVLPGFTLVP